MSDKTSSLKPPERKFCIGGPIPDQGYYMVRNRPETGDILEKLRDGRYFVVYAPRQVGKTSLIDEVEELALAEPRLLPVCMNFQDYPSLRSPEEFYRDFSSDFVDTLDDAMARKGLDDAVETAAGLRSATVSNRSELDTFWKLLKRALPEQDVCLLIDEFEGIPQHVLDEFLANLRSIYLDRKRGPGRDLLHSVGIVGVRSISQMSLGRTSSPFNVRETVSVKSFTGDQVTDLLGQYAEETGEIFPDAVPDLMAEKVAGHPYLVSLWAHFLTQEVKPYTEARRMTVDDAEAAYRILFKSRENSNFDHIAGHIRAKPEYKPLLLRLIHHEKIEYNRFDQTLDEMITLGLVSEEDGRCVISSPAYSTLVFDCFKPTFNGDIADYFPDGYQSFFGTDGFIRPGAVIENLQSFLPQVDPQVYYPQGAPVEVVPHYFLLNQFHTLAELTGGHARAEVHGGGGRLDIMVFEKNSHKTAIECKVWRGEAYRARAREQLLRYLEQEGLQVGYLTFFDARKDAAFRQEEVSLEGRTIHEFVVALPPKLRK